MNDIYGKLLGAVVRVPPPFQAEFWPEGSLSDVVTRATIQPYALQDEKLELFILRHAVKLFAICLSIHIREPHELKDMMIGFQKGKFSDRDLPISEDIMNDRFRDPPWFDIWLKTNFLRNQWLFVAYKFPLDSQSIVRLEDSRVLPFVAVQELPRSEQGNYATIYKVRVPRSHLGLEPDSNHQETCDFALKEVNIMPSQNGKPDGTRKASEKEWAAFMRIMALKGTRSSRREMKHLIDVRAVFDKHWKRYFMIPWASGGSLRQLLTNDRRIHNQRPRELIKHTIAQLLGMAGALAKLHGEGCRHGDLKPENILLFVGDRQPRLGTWKIADFGLAKFHLDPTAIRGATSTMYSTISYEAPEFLDAIRDGDPISRLFDVWSVGCIILQLITWLLYDSQGVKNLADNTWNRQREANTFWTDEKSVKGDQSRRSVHVVVQNHMATILHSPESSQAIKDLTQVVRDKLLVIDTPTVSTGQSPPGTRINSKELVYELKQICGRGARDETYWHESWSLFQRPASGSLLLRPAHLLLTASSSFNQIWESYWDLNEEWKFPLDNDFAQKVISGARITEVVSCIPWPGPSMDLCGRCRSFDFLLPNFQIKDRLAVLKINSSGCAFCNLRWSSCQHLLSRRVGVSAVRFDRSGSNLRLNGAHPPVLTLRIGPVGLDEPARSQLQVGLPRLPEVGGPFYFKILREWLRECDENHKDCKSTRSPDNSLPIRLIDVWPRIATAYVRLHETEQNEKLEYLALSHPWGEEPHFGTSSENIEQHKRGIRLEDLPNTFRDAVTVTRELGFRYLWIDSICIVQGHKGDFDIEGKRMEVIFSKANCVLAASGAKSQGDGFLRSYAAQSPVGIRQPGGKLTYVCEFMDDFGEQVLGSFLSQRGWAFQERVLARRTIYFTNKQCYWECGSGIRCESMAKIQNKMISYLGDPNFPKMAMKRSLGSQIWRYQDLYSKYTELAFTWDTDRAIAILGLQQRLIDSLKLSGGFGVLDGPDPGFLRRSLLWCRADGTEKLDVITFQKRAGGSSSEVPAPPSWSWMAYKGAIKYMQAPFHRVEWEEDDIRSPWSGQPARTWNYGRDVSSLRLAIPIITREFDTFAAPSAGTINLDRHSDDTQMGPNTKCVILGNIKADTQQKRQGVDHFVLLVRSDASSDLHGPQVYHRIGIARMRGSLIQKGGMGIPGLLQ